VCGFEGADKLAYPKNIQRAIIEKKSASLQIFCGGDEKK